LSIKHNLDLKVFNFVGGISKILFGTMDSDDSYYAEKVSNLEKEQLDFLVYLKNK
jgi:hypothetical protein